MVNSSKYFLLHGLVVEPYEPGDLTKKLWFPHHTCVHTVYLSRSQGCSSHFSAFNVISAAVIWQPPPSTNSQSTVLVDIPSEDPEFIAVHEEMQSTIREHRDQVQLTDGRNFEEIGPQFCF